MKAIRGIPANTLKEAIAYCELALEWPPSIAEFISICEKVEGFPSCAEVYSLALKRDFTHELVKRVFNSISEWNFRNDSERELRKKVESSYKENLIQLRRERNHV